MALLWLDSFDHYATADIGEKYTASGNSSIVSGGRHSSNALRIAFGTSLVVGGLTPGDATAIVGVAFKNNNFQAATAYVVVRSGATDQVSLCFTAAGFVEVRRGSGSGTVLGTAVTGNISNNTFYYLELKVVIHPSAGSVIARVNGAEVVNVPVANTSATGGTSWSDVRLFGVSGQANDYDDLYILDGTGAAPLNALLGDVRVDARYPTAEGAASAWTPLSGTDNALMVDETAPDDDTTYNAAPTVGLTDTHVVEDAVVPGATLLGVQLVISAKKSDTGTCALAPVVRHSTTNYSGTAFNPGTTYAYAVRPYGTNPGTGLAWTEADFNAAQFGYTRTA